MNDIIYFSVCCPNCQRVNHHSGYSKNVELRRICDYCGSEYSILNDEVKLIKKENAFNDEPNEFQIWDDEKK